MPEQMTYLISNYNKGKYVKDCLDSLNRQTNPHWLAIICDDKSTDDSVAIIEPRLNDKIKLIQNEMNLGCSRTLKRLIAGATTDILGVLDADDMLTHNATEVILQAYARNPGAGFVYSNFIWFNPERKAKPTM